jgi:hypothetical protein
MNEIQLGIDIATSISVIAAAISFLRQQASSSRATRLLAVRQQRIEQMSRLVADFSNILEAGDKVVEKVRLAQAGRDVNLSTDDYTGFCYSVDRYIRINSKLLFEVWASEDEKKVLQSIGALVHSWNKKFVDAAIEKNMLAIPSFDQLVEDIGAEVVRLSTLLRAEVERVNV